MHYNDNPKRGKLHFWFGPMTLVDYLGNHNLGNRYGKEAHYWFPGTAHEVPSFACKVGFQDALQTLRIAIASDDAVRFADTSMEAISYFAISASSELAAERGRYPSFDGSLWSRGILPIDSVELLAEARGGLDLDRSSTLDWSTLRERVRNTGAIIA